MRDLTTNDTVVMNDGKLSKLGELGNSSEDLGGLKFRESEGKPQYKLPSSDEWVDFSSGGGGAPVLLWENSAPTSAFSSKRISIDGSDFTHYLVDMTYGTNTASSHLLNLVAKNEDRYIFSPVTSNAWGIRNVTNVNDTGLTIGYGFWQAVAQNGSGYSESNGIPLKIYGVKLNFEEG